MKKARLLAEGGLSRAEPRSVKHRYPRGRPGRVGYNAYVMARLVRRLLIVALLAAAAVGYGVGEVRSARASAQDAEPPRAAVPGGGHVAYVRIDGRVYGFTPTSVRRRAERAMQASPRPSVMVIEINTDDGVMSEALEVARYIKEEITVPTFAWVNTKAEGPGLVIASACNHIVMAPGASLGAAAPAPGRRGGAEERAATIGPLLAELVDNSQKRGYPYALLHAASVPGVEVYEIERDEEDGQTRREFVTQADYRVMVEGDSPNRANAEVRRQFLQNFSRYRVVQPPPGSTTPADHVPGEAQVRVADDDDRGQWRLVRQVHDGSRPLKLDAGEAVALGIAHTDHVDDVEAMQAYLNTGPDDRVRIRQTWSENLAEFLTLPAVRMILVVILVLAVFIEMQTMGTGIGAAIALAALLALVGAPVILGLAEIWHLVLFFLGIALILVELFIVPGFGVAGLAGLICLVVGLVLMVVPTTGGGIVPMPAEGTAESLRQSILAIVAGVAIAGLLVGLLIRHFGRVPMFDWLILKDEGSERRLDADHGDDEESEAFAMTDPSRTTTAAGAEVTGYGRIRIGATGEVITGLRPAGRVLLDGHAVDVVSSGGWIERGRRVKVVEVEGNRIVVEAADEG